MAGTRRRPHKPSASVHGAVSSAQSVVAQHASRTKRRRVLWGSFPPELRRACDLLLAEWWETLDSDQPISGLLDMAMVQLLAALHGRCAGSLPLAEEVGGLQRRFRVVSYLRVEPEDSLPVPLAEALSELDQLQLLDPESIHHIEEMCQVIVASDDQTLSQAPPNVVTRCSTI